MTEYLIEMLFIDYLAVLADLRTFPLKKGLIKYLLITSYFDHDVIEMIHFDRK